MQDIRIEVSALDTNHSSCLRPPCFLTLFAFTWKQKSCENGEGLGALSGCKVEWGGMERGGAQPQITHKIICLYHSTAERHSRCLYGWNYSPWLVRNSLLSFVHTCLNICPPPLGQPRTHSHSKCSQAFAALPLPSIIVNSTGKVKMGRPGNEAHTNPYFGL